MKSKKVPKGSGLRVRIKGTLLISEHIFFG